MHDDRVGGFFRRFRAGQGTHLQAVVGVFDRALETRFAQTQTLHAGAQPRVVHHGEHAVQALVRLADQEAFGAVEVQDAGGGCLDAHFVFDRAAGHAVAFTGFTRCVGQELWHDKQRNTLGPDRCVRQFRQHQMNDVVAHVVLTGRDENLAAGNRIAAVCGRYGTRLDDAQIGAAMGFGQAHGAGPLTSGEFVQVSLFLLCGAVGVDRRHGAVGQARVHAP
ncbi:hypothetical protein D3C87_1265330 [compost metagenome]